MKDLIYVTLSLCLHSAAGSEEGKFDFTFGGFFSNFFANVQKSLSSLSTETRKFHFKLEIFKKVHVLQGSAVSFPPPPFFSTGPRKTSLEVVGARFPKKPSVTILEAFHVTIE